MLPCRPACRGRRSRGRRRAPTTEQRCGSEEPDREPPAALEGRPEGCRSTPCGGATPGSGIGGGVVGGSATRPRPAFLRRPTPWGDATDRPTRAEASRPPDQLRGSLVFRVRPGGPSSGDLRPTRPGVAPLPSRPATIVPCRAPCGDPAHPLRGRAISLRRPPREPRPKLLPGLRPTPRSRRSVGDARNDVAARLAFAAALRGVRPPDRARMLLVEPLTLPGLPPPTRTIVPVPRGACDPRS
jgi:hypothetical protein